MNRTPPHDLDAEMSVLGTMMDSIDAAATVAEILRSDDFYKPAHQDIYAGLIALYQRGEATDAVILANELQSQGVLGRIGGKPYLLGLLEAFSTTSAAGEYARLVRRMAQLRSLITVLDDLRDKAYGKPRDLEALLDHAEAAVFSVSRDDRTSDHAPRTLYDDMPLIMSSLEDDSKADQPLGFRSGIGTLDELLGGIQRGRFIVVGADTSKGKTSLLAQLSVEAAKQGRRTLFVTLEQPRTELIHRILAQQGGVNVSHLTNPQLLTDDDWANISKTIGSIPGDRIWTADGSADVDTIMAKLRRASLRGGAPIDLLVVDYVQLVETEGRVEHRTQEIGAVSRALKRLANDLGITVITASQLNRSYTKEKRRPILADLRESGSLEQDPDLVLLLHRPDKKELDKDYADVEQPSTMKITEILIRKNRHGPTGTVGTYFDEPHNLFTEIGA